MNSVKKWFESRTIWFNLFMGISGVALAVKPELAEWLNEGVFSAFWGIANLFLRAKTDKAIEA